jgi:hypothetical protein
VSSWAVAEAGAVAWLGQGRRPVRGRWRGELPPARSRMETEAATARIGNENEMNKTARTDRMKTPYIRWLCWRSSDIRLCPTASLTTVEDRYLYSTAKYNHRI